MWSSIGNKKRLQAGFTLVEIAVVMVIVGILLAAGMGAYKIYLTQTKIDKTKLAGQFVSYSLDDFKRRYGRYPCPARSDLPSTDPQYGRESDCKNTTLQPGNCANGLCVEISKRTVNINGVTVTPRVRRGMLPFRDMLLDEEKAYDAYGGRFSYAVTENLTDSDIFDNRKGGISIVDDHEPEPQSLVHPEHSGMFFVFSHGPDNVGAYGSEGQLLAECRGTMHDNENCNTSNIHKEAVYRYKLRNDQPIDSVDGGVLIPGAPPSSVDVNRHYDDVADFGGNTREPIFKYSEEEGRTGDAHDTLADKDKLSIGKMKDEDKTLKLNVDGNTKVTDKSKITDACSAGGEDCIQPYLIGGTGMKCDGDLIASGVGDREMKCKPREAFRTQCPSGQYIVAIAATGEVTCKAVQFCKPYSVTRTNQPCPGGMAGTATFTETKTCPDGNVTTVQTGGNCVCQPSSSNSTDFCADGSVYATYREGYRCVGGAPQYFRETLTQNTCPSGPPPPSDPPKPPVSDPETRICSWSVGGGQRSGSFSLSRPKVGSTCACGTKNRICYSTWVSYSACRCE